MWAHTQDFILKMPHISLHPPRTSPHMYTYYIYMELQIYSIDK